MMHDEETGIGPVTVVVCNYEGREHLGPCLDAIGALRGNVAEVLLVDNASTDGSVDFVREAYPHVRVLAREHNDGPAAARNEGLLRASTRWVLALDNDAVVAPDLLEKLAAAAAAEPEAVLVQPRSVFDHDPERVHYDGGAFHYTGLIALRNFYRPVAEAAGEGVVEVDCAVAVALLCDRERLGAIGGWDDAYFILFEDLDLSWRVRVRGWKVLSVEDALVRHRHGTAGVSFRAGPRYPERRTFYHARNRWRFLARNLGGWTLFCAAPGLAVYEVASLCFALAEGNGGAWLRGKREFVRSAREARGALGA
ncbi:MAG: glycosyltransferase family 2 protein, partial [Planctomycetota bacterium]|nr:glycosyltransferase family 2 protein [Planctomycetota bacterium]